jgi:hypothetical protein
MSKLKIVLVCAAVGAGMIAGVIHYGTHASAGNGPRAQAPDPNRPQAFVTNPIVPAESSPSKQSGYGWGPVRLTDW